MQNEATPTSLPFQEELLNIIPRTIIDDDPYTIHPENGLTCIVDEVMKTMKMVLITINMF